MAILGFELWGSSIPEFVILGKLTIQKILFAIRVTPKSVEDISHEIHASIKQVRVRLHELKELDLVIYSNANGERWLANFPIFEKSDFNIAYEIGQRYANVESEILREELPYIEGIYNACRISEFHPWSENSNFFLFILNSTDRVAERIHNEVVIPAREECMRAALDVGLRFPLPGWGTLPRDIAIQHLVDDGLIVAVPDPPVKWNWCVWGWEGKLPLWEEVRA